MRICTTSILISADDIENFKFDGVVKSPINYALYRVRGSGVQGFRVRGSGFGVQGLVQVESRWRDLPFAPTEGVNPG